MSTTVQELRARVAQRSVPDLDPTNPVVLQILALYLRIRGDIEADDDERSGDGGDVVEALAEWFTQLGLDVDADLRTVLARLIRLHDLRSRSPEEQRRTRQTRMPARPDGLDVDQVVRAHRDGPGDVLDLDRIAHLVRQAGVPCRVEQTGGGVATLFAGDAMSHGPQGGLRYAAAAGPGSYGWGRQPSRACVQELCVGPDDDGEHEPIDAAAVGAFDDHTVAWLIVAQARAATPHEPLSGDAVAALGLGPDRTRPR